MPESVLVQVVRLSISFEKEVHERVTDLADAHDVSTAWTKGRWKVGMSNTKLKMRVARSLFKMSTTASQISPPVKRKSKNQSPNITPTPARAAFRMSSRKGAETNVRMATAGTSHSLSSGDTNRASPPPSQQRPDPARAPEARLASRPARRRPVSSVCLWAAVPFELPICVTGEWIA